MESTTLAQVEVTTLANTASGVLEAYLAELDASEKTRATYQRALRQYMAWLEEQEVELDHTTRAHIMAYKHHLEETRSANTCATYLVAVRNLYAWLNARTGYPDVAQGVKNPKRSGHTSKDALTLTQARDLLNAPAQGERELRDAAMVALMLRRGLRTVEVARANVGDLRQLCGKAVLYVQGKGHSDKDDFVVLGEAVERAIRAYLKERGQVLDEEPLFTSVGNRNSGGRMTTRAISRVAKDAMRALGIDSPHITAHSLRHTAVTLSLVGGATVQEAQAMARHANISTTMVYAHNLEKMDARAESAIDELLAG